MSPTQELNSFIAFAAKQTSFSTREIRQILKEQFKTFSSKNTEQYLQFLHKYKQDKMAEIDQTRKEQFARAAKATEIWEREQGEKNPCPYHPQARTHGTHRWYGKHTHTPSWTCSEGGDTCFLRHKLDSMLVAAGKQPVDWPNVDIPALLDKQLTLARGE